MYSMSMSGSSPISAILSIFPLVVFFLGLFGTVISLDCIWRTKGSLKVISWGLLFMSAVSIAAAVADFLIQSTATLYSVIFSGFVLLAAGSAGVGLALYHLVRVVEKKDR